MSRHKCVRITEMQGVTCFKYVSDVLLVAMENRHLLGFG